MTGKNWMKAIALTGAAAVVAALIPASSSAKTYTGKPKAASDFAMVTNPVVTPTVALPVSTKHTKTLTTHKKKPTVLTHHKKKHGKVTKKH